MTLVLDSSALIAYLKQEPGAPLVRALIERNRCHVHAINLCEVYYDFLRSQGGPAATRMLVDVVGLGVVIQEDMDSEFWQQVGRYKADLRRVSLADCFCITLARRLQAPVVTTDHHEFDAVERKGVCAVRFIR
jgi:PIN domain nuclease of toxin-antitoxin system